MACLARGSMEGMEAETREVEEQVVEKEIEHVDKRKSTPFNNVTPVQSEVGGHCALPDT